MDRQLLVGSTEISPELSQRLRKEVTKDPKASEKLRSIATQALQNGRIFDAFLMGMEAKAMEQMAANIK